jgi:uncharacterized protein (DUF1330 family)
MKKHSFLKYNGFRIRVDSIVRYSPQDEGRSQPGLERYGISFLTRDGDAFTIKGDDEDARDKALAFLDNAFNPKEFKAWICQNCANRKDDCEDECNDFESYPNFKRIEEGT